MINYKPILYKLSSAGKTQFWQIAVEDSTIVTRWGQIDGKVQETRDVITEGKNTGKVNATTASEQALAEAESQWTKKLKSKGYVTTLESAQAGERDALVAGGVDPMLAFPFEKQGHKIKHPCFGNVKLDGTRCLATIFDGKCSLWSRTRKPINSMPHIVATLEKAFPSQTLTLDGELYAHHLNNDFEHLIHLVRSSSAVEGYDQMQYWVYDMVTDGTFEERFNKLSSILPDSPHLVLVEAVELVDEPAMMEYFANCKLQGYEGAIIRNKAGKYVGKRSADLIKLKTFLDGEFKIVDIEEGRGKLQGHVGSFVCATVEGKRFSAKLEGKLENLKRYWEDHALWNGKQMTVRYFELTSEGIPRFPIGVAIRDYE